MASCVPVECWGEWRKAHYLPHAHILMPFTPPKPAKLGRQFLLKPSLILIYMHVVYPCTHPLLSPHTYLFWVLHWELFSFLSLLSFLHTHRGPKSLHAMCHCFWHTELNSSLEHGSNHPCTQSYLCPAAARSAGRLSLLVGYEQLAGKTF